MAAPLLLRAVERFWVPWKNGGGLTSLVAVDGAAAGEDWTWRISVAHVDAAGPFSHFAGIDRVLTVLSGILELTDSTGQVALLSPGRMERFAGEAAIVGRPIGGGVVDLNVMHRRAQFDAHVTHLCRPTGEHVAMEAAVTILFASTDALVTIDDERFDMAPHDALLLEGAAASVFGHIGGGDLYLIELIEVSPTAQPS